MLWAMTVDDHRRTTKAKPAAAQDRRQRTDEASQGPKPLNSFLPGGQCATSLTRVVTQVLHQTATGGKRSRESHEDSRVGGTETIRLVLQPS